MIRTTLSALSVARAAPAALPHSGLRGLLVARAAPAVLPHSGLRGRRRGVTLVEMLVATAMCIAGMWMLTWMFQQATASFSLANARRNRDRAISTAAPDCLRRSAAWSAERPSSYLSRSNC